MPESIERTTDVLSPDDQKTMVEMLDTLMVPGFPLDKRCLNKEKRDKTVVVTTVAGTYLAESKTTFPVSEHLTPQQFLMQAGFSAFQAHSVCENRRIKGKLTAAIKEARVWLNCMTKNQALLIYGLSVKLMTKEMPHLFLQLTEAIANNRIQNMMQLFDYLRLMKNIGRLPLQSEFADTTKNVLMKDSRKLKKKPAPPKKPGARAAIVSQTPSSEDELSQKLEEIAKKPDEVVEKPAEDVKAKVSPPVYSRDEDKTEIVIPSKTMNKSSDTKTIKKRPSMIFPTKFTQMTRTDSSSSIRSIGTQTEPRKKKHSVSTQVIDKPLKIPKESKREKLIPSKEEKTFLKKSKPSSSIKKTGTESSSSSEGEKEMKKISGKKQTKTSDHIFKTKPHSSTKKTKTESRKFYEGAERKIPEKKLKKKSSSKEDKKQQLSSIESKPGHSKATREIPSDEESFASEQAKELPISAKLKRKEPPTSKGERKLRSLKKTPLTSDKKSRKTDSSSSNESKGESMSSSKGAKKKKSSTPKKIVKRPSTSTQGVKKKNSKLNRRFKKK